MWKLAASAQCGPLVRNILRWSWYIETMGCYKCSMDMLTTLTDIASKNPIDRDTFNPTTWEINDDKYLWWTWLTDGQLKHFQHDGTIPGLKATHGDNRWLTLDVVH
eukprot:6037077-Amphidinium_carterae.2